MGVFVSYLIEVTLVMSVLYVCYRLLLSSATFHRFKRITLLTVILFSWFAPLFVGVPQMRSGSVSESVQAVGGGAGENSEEMLPGNGAVEIGMPVAVDVIESPTREATPSVLWKCMAWIYYGGLVSGVLFTLISISRLRGLIRGGERKRTEEYTLVINELAPGPFSWGRYIVMRPQDFDTEVSMVLAHERRHLHAGHWIDSLLLQVNTVLLWFNPLSYLLQRDLKCIHEYEADMAIAPAQSREYQLMLIKKTVGSSFPTFANSLNHSQIKKRITMMMKKQSNSVRRLSALALPAVAVLAMMGLSQPSVAQMLGNVRMAFADAPQADKVSNISTDEQIVAAYDAISSATEQVEEESGAAVQSESAAKPQEEMEKIVILGTDSAGDKEGAAAQTSKLVYFVNGELYTKPLNTISPSSIKSMKVVKDDPAYPDGKILIELKDSASAESDGAALAAEKIAEFKGGQKAMLKFLSDNIKPVQGLQGDVRVIVQFTVNTDGSVSGVNVIRGGGEQADAEAVRVVSLMSGMWTPAQTGGEPIATKFVLPISFKATAAK